MTRNEHASAGAPCRLNRNTIGVTDKHHPADWTLMEAAQWIAERDQVPGNQEDGDSALRRAVNALQERLTAGDLTGSGAIDAGPHGPISTVTWRHVVIERESGFFAGHDVADLGGTSYLEIYETNAVPARVLHDLSRPAGWNGSDGQPAYHRRLTDVTVPRADVGRLWPPVTSVHRQTALGRKRCHELLAEIVRPEAPVRAKAEVLAESGRRSRPRSWRSVSAGSRIFGPRQPRTTYAGANPGAGGNHRASNRRTSLIATPISMDLLPSTSSHGAATHDAP